MREEAEESLCESDKFIQNELSQPNIEIPNELIFNNDNDSDNENDEEKISKKSLISFLHNFEDDLIIHDIDKNSKKEFDLKKDDFTMVKIYGNPKCRCGKNIINSSETLFYCSHCDKCFCKDCLNFHYREYQNIEDSFSKHFYDINNGAILLRIKEQIGNCQLFLLYILLFFFDLIYLLPIFAMKPMLSALQGILINCVKEAFTHKIEEPNSLFNFYELFFNNIKNLHFDFALIMLMNWLGDNLINSCKIYGVIPFWFINGGFFSLIYFFNFLEYNENNKYNFGKFSLLAFGWVLLFLGLGGSSMISQKIFIEILEKIKFYKEQKEKEEEERQKNLKDNKDINEQNNLDDMSENSKLRHEIRKKQVENRKDMKGISVVTDFVSVTIITILSFIINLIYNSFVLYHKKEKDEEIKENLNINNITNTNLTRTIYESDKDIFFYYYFSYYLGCMLLSFILFLIIEKGCMEEIKSKEAPEPSEFKEFKEKILGENEIRMSRILSKEQIKESELKDSYSTCKICGYYYISQKKYREKSGCMAFCHAIKEFILLTLKTFFDCFDSTFCNVLNILFCCGEKIFCCEIKCKGCEEKYYNKNSEDFCICYKQKRKSKWFHDYISSDIQKEFFPCLLEYFFLGLIIIYFQKKFPDLKIDFFSKSIKEFTLDDIEIILIILITFVLAFAMTVWKTFKTESKAEEKKPILGSIKNGTEIKIDINEKIAKKEEQEQNDNSFSIFNAMYNVFFVACLISFIFSIYYFVKNDNFGHFILIPVAIYNYFYFLFNFYYVNEAVEKNRKEKEFIITGSILITVYLFIWDNIYKNIIDLFEKDIDMFTFQMFLSGIIILSLIYYYFSRTEKKKESIDCKTCKQIINNNCNKCLRSCSDNCTNINFCRLCQCCQGFCCSYSCFILKGKLFCDCCCCDYQCGCCYSKYCEYNCYDCCKICFCNSNNDNKEENIFFPELNQYYENK